MLLRERIPKTPTTIYPHTIVSDRYENDSYTYTEPTETIELMWYPLSSESDVVEYGERINEMLQAVLCDKLVEIKEKDRVSIDEVFYTVKSIKKYPTYRLLTVERV